MINRIATYFDAATSAQPQSAEPVEPAANGRIGLVVERQRRRVERAISLNPGLALAAAVILGVALAWWIKRR